MKRGRADIFLLAGLLLAFAILTYLIAGKIPESAELVPRRTSYSARPGGLKAAFLLLERYGIPLGRLHVKPQQWPKNAQVVITATPYGAVGMKETWDASEVKAAVKWLEQGGNLLLLQSDATDLQKALKLESDTHLKVDALLAPQQPAEVVQGIKGVRFPDRERFNKTPPEAVSLFGDRKPAAVVFRRGKGAVIALATPAVFDNTNISKADNARLLVQIVALSQSGKGKVYFDEYHQGYQEQETLWTLIGKPGQFAFYQLLLLILLIVYTTGRRFGLPHPMPPPPRVSSEYVASLANLYRRARVTDAALEAVYLVFWHDLCRATGIPNDSPLGEVAHRAMALVSPDKDRTVLERNLLRLLGECEDKMAAGPKVLDEKTMLRLANEIEDMRKDLQLAGND